MRWRKFWGRRQVSEALFDSELRFHLNELIEEKVAAGLPLEQARRQASLEFGGQEQLKEDLRDIQRIACWKA
jgi:hypothetical protein